MSSVSQLGQTAAGMAQQSAHAVTGLAQQAAQLAMGLAQQAGQAEQAGGCSGRQGRCPCRPGDEDKKNEEKQREEAEKRDREREGAAAPSGEQSTGTAPVAPTPVDRGDATSLPSDQAIKRTR
jgi:hypothetical protein